MKALSHLSRSQLLRSQTVEPIIAYVPDGVTETVGDEFGVLSLRVMIGLERFKEFIESRHPENSTWKGTGQVTIGV